MRPRWLEGISQRENAPRKIWPWEISPRNIFAVGIIGSGIFETVLERLQQVSNVWALEVRLR